MDRVFQQDSGVNMIVFVGGFSNSDVLGSAKGWAGAFLYNPKAKAALDRLIDQELLREQVRPSEQPPAADIAARVSEVRKLHPEAATDNGWLGALQHCGLTQTDLEMRLGQSIELMRLVEARLRPSIQIDQKAVESYYHEQLLPELQKAGGREVALPEVFGHIRDLLAEQRLNQLLHGWLATLRSASHIQTPQPGGGDQTP